MTSLFQSHFGLFAVSQIIAALNAKTDTFFLSCYIREYLTQSAEGDDLLCAGVGITVASTTYYHVHREIPAVVFTATSTEVNLFMAFGAGRISIVIIALSIV